MLQSPTPCPVEDDAEKIVIEEAEVGEEDVIEITIEKIEQDVGEDEIGSMEADEEIGTGIMILS